MSRLLRDALREPTAGGRKRKRGERAARQVRACVSRLVGAVVRAGKDSVQKKARLSPMRQEARKVLEAGCQNELSSQLTAKRARCDRREVCECVARLVQEVQRSKAVEAPPAVAAAPAAEHQGLASEYERIHEQLDARHQKQRRRQGGKGRPAGLSVPFRAWDEAEEAQLVALMASDATDGAGGWERKAAAIGGGRSAGAAQQHWWHMRNKKRTRRRGRPPEAREYRMVGSPLTNDASTHFVYEKWASLFLRAFFLWDAQAVSFSKLGCPPVLYEPRSCASLSLKT